MQTSSIFQEENIIFIKGGVFFQNVAFVQKILVNLLKKKKFHHYVFDLSLLDAVDSAALSMFIELKKIMNSEKLTGEFINATERLLSLAEVYGLDFLDQ